jgi:hypothetical protein
MFFINKAVKGRNKILNMFLEGSTVIKQEYLGKLSSSLEKKLGSPGARSGEYGGLNHHHLFFFSSCIAYIIV